MNRKQQIRKLARQYGENVVRGSSGTNARVFGRGVASYHVWSYMRQWLDDHDELPSGVHTLSGPQPRLHRQRRAHG
jgi:hypothetical protein